MARHRDIEWNLPDKVQTWEQVNTAILMDIRDELKKLNRLIGCPNFTDVPNILRGIRRKLPEKKRKRRVTHR